jgi:hypothetical protein
MIWKKVGGGEISMTDDPMVVGYRLWVGVVEWFVYYVQDSG